MPEVEEISRPTPSASAAPTAGWPPWTRPSRGPTSSTPRAGAPYAAMEKRTGLYAQGDTAGIQALERELGPERPAQGLELHRGAHGPGPRPARPSTSTASPPTSPGVSCQEGEVDASVFDRLPGAPLQGGQLQALHHRGHDPDEQSEGPGLRADGPGPGQQAEAVLIVLKISSFGGNSAGVPAKTI